MLQRHFDRLKERHPAATIEGLPSGAFLVTVPEVALPAGWSLARTTIRFIAPVGYPAAKPDCFWADRGLKLESGAPPASANEGAIPETPLIGHWFSWHVPDGQWVPNRDDLSTYLRVVRDRFEQAR
ncbi:MAG: E2/UBC family protein [Polyangiales bacterium]